MDKLFSLNLYQFLKEKIPPQMIPKAFSILENIPLNMNGKVDRKNLPAPENFFDHDIEFVEPKSSTEINIVKIWKELLQTKIGIKHNFFHSGGHSLTAVQLSGKLREKFNIEIPIREIFSNPTVEELAKIIEKFIGRVSNKLDIKGIKNSIIPLSFQQQRLWFLDSIIPIQQVYNIPLIILFKEYLNVDIFCESLKILTERHHVLRTFIKTINGEPQQVILKEIKINFNSILSNDDYIDGEHTDYIKNEINTLIAINEAPLWRCKLILYKNNNHLLIFTIHHIIADAWSLRILIQDLADIYNTLLNNKSLKLLPLYHQYADFSSWQRSDAWIFSQKFSTQLNYWRSLLTGYPDLLKLPSFQKRPLEQSYRGAHCYGKIMPELYIKIEIFIKQHHITLFSFLMTTFHILLARLTQQDDIVVGFPINNRHYQHVKDIIGFFANTIPLKSHYDSKKSFLDYLYEINENLLNSQANQDVPFELLVDELKINRDLSRHPLFQVMLVLQEDAGIIKNFSNTLGHRLNFSTDTAKFDLLLLVTKHETHLDIDFEYASDLFSAEYIEQIYSYFNCLITQIIICPTEKIGWLSILPEKAYKQLIYEFNATHVPYPDTHCIHQLIFERAQFSLTASAVLYDDVIITYIQLLNYVHSLAHFLYKQGFRKGDIVVICLPRSEWMIIAILALLEIGAIYVPIDPQLPSERIQYMVDNCCGKALLTDSNFVGEKLRFLELQTIFLNEIISLLEAEDTNPLNLHVSPHDLICIIYTSGSTGKPKGVECTHRGLVNRIFWMQSQFQLKQQDRILHKTPLLFDVAGWELFWPLIAGAQLVIAPPEAHKDAVQLAQLIQRFSITVIHFVPTMLQAFIYAVSAIECQSLRYIFSSGEALTLDLVRKCQHLSTQLHNLYGPTEASIDATHWLCIDNLYDGIVPIGKPISNMHIYILDRSLQPVPIGVQGEIYISGVGLARAYVNREDLTEQNFISNPFTHDTDYLRIYKTGDLGRFLPDGNIEYLGRIDQQVKLKGYRIELGEIEFILRQHAQVQDAVAIIHINFQTKQQELIVYITSRNLLAEEKIKLLTYELKINLQEFLPEYMLPKQLIYLKKLPLLHSGKIDRKKLMEIKIDISYDNLIQLPLNEAEKILCKIWQDLLGLENVSTDQNFFNIGGDSILSIQLISRLRQHEFNLSVADIFRYPTIAKLANFINSHDKLQATKNIAVNIKNYEIETIQAEVEDIFPAALLQVGMIFHSNLSKNFPVYQDIFSYMIQAPYSPNLFEAALVHVSKKHPMLRAAFSLNKDSEPLIVIYKKENPVLFCNENNEIDSAKQEKIINSWIETEKNNRFDLYVAPLVRFTLHNFGNNKFHFG